MVTNADIGAAAHQERRLFEPTAHRGVVERSPAIGVAGVKFSSLIQEELHAGHVPEPRGNVEWRLAVFVSHSKIRSSGNQLLGNRLVPRLIRRQKQERLALPPSQVGVSALRKGGRNTAPIVLKDRERQLAIDALEQPVVRSLLSVHRILFVSQRGTDRGIEKKAGGQVLVASARTRHSDSFGQYRRELCPHAEGMKRNAACEAVYLQSRKQPSLKSWLTLRRFSCDL